MYLVSYNLQWLICHKTKPNKTKPNLNLSFLQGKIHSNFGTIKFGVRSKEISYLYKCIWMLLIYILEISCVYLYLVFYNISL